MASGWEHLVRPNVISLRARLRAVNERMLRSDVVSLHARLRAVNERVRAPQVRAPTPTKEEIRAHRAFVRKSIENDPQILAMKRELKMMKGLLESYALAE